MRAQVARQPEQKTAKHLLDQHDAQWLSEHKPDDKQRHRLKTVELIVKNAPQYPPPVAHRESHIASVRVAFKEAKLQRRQLNYFS